MVRAIIQLREFEMFEMGKNGFTWWFGVVEDINDPLQLGRVRVRCYNFHTTNAAELPTEDLPWAHVIMPVTSASYQGKGWSPTFLRVDATVFGFFADGNLAQHPIIMGTLPGIPQSTADQVDAANISEEQHDVNKLARGINKLLDVKNQVYNAETDPIDPVPGFLYGAQYPHNKTFESERGHVIEVDDTPGAERLHMYHTGGSFVEMGNGMTVDKTNGIKITSSTQMMYTKSGGDAVLIVGDDSGGTLQIWAGGAISITSQKQISLDAPLININGQLGVTIQSIGPVSISSTLTTTITGLVGLYLNPL